MEKQQEKNEPFFKDRDDQTSGHHVTGHGDFQDGIPTTEESANGEHETPNLPLVFGFTGNAQQISLRPGRYQIECWGASGGNGMQNGRGITNHSRGGYSSGIVDFQDTTTLHIYVGGRGANGSATARSIAPGGWNGGGNGGADRDNDGSGSGGGASDIRLVGGAWNQAESLHSRIMVAGGASGGLWTYSGMNGGGLSGQGRGGTQTTGFSFGIGQVGGHFLTGPGTPGSGAGGGYYGGFSGAPPIIGGGGSGFISGHPGADAIDEDGHHTGQPLHFSGIYFNHTRMQMGVNPGNGRVVITPLAKLHVLLEPDEQVQLSITHQLSQNAEVAWHSTSSEVAIVDNSGLVTAIDLGNTQIWARSLDEIFQDYIPVKVIEGAEKLRLALHLIVGETRRLWLTDDATDVTWTSMDPSVATVDHIGRVTGVGKGLCIIRAELAGIEQYIYARVND